MCISSSVLIRQLETAQVAISNRMDKIVSYAYSGIQHSNLKKEQTMLAHNNTDESQTC